MTPTDPIEDSILALTAARGPHSICPSEVARALLPETCAKDGQQSWQSLMGPVRQAAVRLAQTGRIEILRKGRPVPPGPDMAGNIRGVIRLRVRSDA